MPEFDFDDLIKNIVDSKRLAAQMRFSKHEANEVPREVYLSVCQAIADYYAPYGFKYAKSQQHMTLKQKGSEYAFRISFSSSHYNVADHNVSVTVCANVISTKYKKWQEEHTEYMLDNYYSPNEYVAGGLIGNLQENHVYLKWNVANPDTRAKETEDIINHINKLAIPFFNSFNDIPRLIEYIKQKGEYFGIFDIPRLTYFLLYVADKETVEQTYKQFLTNRQMWHKYYTAMEQLSGPGELKDKGTYWSAIALITKHLGLKIEP